MDAVSSGVLRQSNGGARGGADAGTSAVKQELGAAARLLRARGDQREARFGAALRAVVFRAVDFRAVVFALTAVFFAAVRVVARVAAARVAVFFAAVFFAAGLAALRLVAVSAVEPLTL